MARVHTWFRRDSKAWTLGAEVLLYRRARARGRGVAPKRGGMASSVQATDDEFSAFLCEQEPDCTEYQGAPNPQRQ